MYIFYIFFMIGTIAATCAGIPQLLKLLRTKRADEFNVSTWLVWLFSQVTSLAYALSTHEMLYATVSALWAAFYLFMVVLIYRYRTASDASGDTLLIEEA